jgi:hypothetical protein
MKHLKEILLEKKLTDAELKKREEVASAIEREHPNMPVSQKMAIATSVAIRSEGVERVPFNGTTEEFLKEMSQCNAISESVNGKQYFKNALTNETMGTIGTDGRAFIYEPK